MAEEMPMTDVRFAWRNLKSRGWRPVLAIVLIATAVAANTVMFAVTDSLVFQRAAYRGTDRLVEFQSRDTRSGQTFGSSMSPATFEAWQQQRDLFEAVEGHLSKVIFLTGSGGEPELVPAADVTSGLTDLLGVRPRWGRPFVEGDQRSAGAHTVLIAESLARERFGDAARAVGQTLHTTAEPLLIAGVMPADFRYPDGSQRIWRALDPHGPLAFGYSLSAIARLAPGLSFETASAIVERRGAEIDRATGARAGRTTTAGRLRMLEPVADQRTLLLMLLTAALCLLLIACANVASLELAGAMTRARTYAIQLAVGASRASLVRTSLIEGALLVAAALGLATVMANAASTLAVTAIPPALANSANPIDVDARAMLFMVAIAGATWLLASLPVVAFAARTNLLAVLKLEGSSVAASRGGARFRRTLTTIQVAVAVVLLAGSVLYVRSYRALLRLDKGFDSAGIVAISLTIPPQSYGTDAERRATIQTILDRVRARPGVVAAFEGAPPPSVGDSPTFSKQIEIDDRPPHENDLLFPRLSVEPDYFTVLGIPLLAGRMFQPGDPPNNVIISQALAARLWPNDNAVGHRFRGSPSMPWNHVIGVVGHVRMLQDGTSGPRRYYQLYAMRQLPRAEPQAGPGPRRFAVRAFGFMTITARVDSRARAGDLYKTVRSVDPRNILKVEFVDDQYARQFADRLLASRIVTGFGALAFIVSAAGIYGLMAFLVASRSRELGIRVALGADAHDIRTLVFGSSVRLVASGVVIGVLATLGAARWMRSQLFAIEPTDPATLIGVALVVLATAVLATWHPARQAARVDPRELLKG
jgi:putative ABC transport system permease protein